ncbi:MAG: DUF2922 domain-containing protein [Bacillota bacterium]|jgi:hypothetical protein|nr:DUF2922 domain-containing protein [Bacillota bacterium]
MVQTLQLIFSTAGGRNTTISLADPDPEITAQDVEAVMDSVLARNVFNTTSGDITGKVRAQIVSREVSVLGEY